MNGDRIVSKGTRRRIILPLVVNCPSSAIWPNSQTENGNLPALCAAWRAAKEQMLRNSRKDGTGPLLGKLV